MFGSKKTTCAKCGKVKKFIPRNKHGGTVCESGHLICSKCSALSFKERVSPGRMAAGLALAVVEADDLMSDNKKKCPICESKLRKIKKDDLAGVSEQSSQNQGTPSSAGSTVKLSQEVLASEKSFYNSDDVTVTSARLLAAGETYAMSGVTSVKMRKEEPSRKGPVVLGVIGALFLIPVFAEGEFGGLLWAAVLIGLAAFWWKRKKNMYHVVLRTASGESQAYHSHDETQISGIVEAINNAIVHRG
ncbi:DUF6232 family protein [Candidatus Pacebacteria bacterium]|nr:DUF6232 family protein [Candidatus Paceibacterota bacterium]